MAYETLKAHAKKTNRTLQYIVTKAILRYCGEKP
jgi:hypothetical protein